ncbi:hypothetical protein RJT34_13684 [Clitoria ternatea]|uniref:Uncharacterized protein n=1 Tax=Clitoria ternatea TaxID=43366 RepID=A0AAN9JRK3_CLITE
MCNINLFSLVCIISSVCLIKLPISSCKIPPSQNKISVEDVILMIINTLWYVYVSYIMACKCEIRNTIMIGVICLMCSFICLRMILDVL